MSFQRVLRTAVWHGDRPLQLDFPPDWEVTTLWPETPPPLTDEQIIEVLERPTGQAPIRQLCRGKSRPLVIVDDLNRPTPAAQVMPFVLRHFEDAGIGRKHVTILMAGGTHGQSGSDAVQRKVGQAAASCRLVVHDPGQHGVKMGRTSFGSPVLVNAEVAASDFVIGIGGIYPNQTAGFGGGSKLALGAMDLRAISYLHHRHRGVGWGALALEGNFRQDLNEVARKIGLNTVISVQVNSDREIIRLACGDPLLYYPQEAAFARQTFRARPPNDADVVISNSYPNDLSFTFVWMKGLAPLRRCPLQASRIVIASCSEGLGSHGVYPVVEKPRFHAPRDFAGRLAVMSPPEIVGKIFCRISRRLGAGAKAPGIPMNPAKTEPKPEHPIWLYRPGTHPRALPSTLREARVRTSWPEIIEAVQREQGRRNGLKVLLYPCAPLQFLDSIEKGTGTSDQEEGTTETAIVG